MRRSYLVAAGTVTGIAGVLAFPTQHAKLSLPTTVATAPSTASSASAPISSGATTTGKVASPSPSSTVPRVATGADEVFRYGDLAVTVTVEGNKITKVTMATLNESDGRSVSIDSFAVPQLEQQVIAANSANINGVSGATYTSQAFDQSLASALSKLGFQA